MAYANRRLRTFIVDSVVRRFASTIPKDISVTRNGKGIVHLSLDRTAAYNALSKNMLSELETTLSALHDDDSVKVMIVKSSVGKVFCAGADLKERATMNNEQTECFVEKIRNTFQALAALPFPTIAAIEGAALGGGLEMALACDLRIVGANAILGLPETALGIIPGAGGTQRLPRTVGVAKAKELIFTAARLSATQAASIGLINESVEAGSAVKRAEELAETMAMNGPIAMRMAKVAVDRGLEHEMENALEVEKQCYSNVVDTTDRLEGIAAFKEKRKPIFTGN